MSKDDAESIARENLALQKQQLQLSGRGALIDADASIASMTGQIEQYEIDMLDYGQQIKSYDQWLANYDNLYRMNTLAKDAEIAQFQQSGLESYESFMNAIGTQESDAAMTGRIGAGTSSAAAAGQLDRNLVTNFGADRSLEGTDGIYGMQSEVQTLEKADLELDLANQKESMTGQKDVAEQAVERTGDAISEAQKNKKSAQAERARLQQFVNAI